ncbi:MAG: S9 family peptidase [Methylococcaceae bacterium]|nr:S9 family peptidase [Methylococcaceae bacterium]
MLTTRPYGSWPSPISSELIVAKIIGLDEINLANDAIYWLESRPEENGRSVIVRQGSDGATQDVFPASFNARNRVHEYGGGDYLVSGDSVYFSNFADQRLYRVTPGTAPEAISPEGAFRYADAILDKHRQRLICIREDHSNAGSEPVNTIVGVSLTANLPADVSVLVTGADFYSSPRLSPDGRYLCWISWEHTNMPWDSTELWVAEIRDDGLLNSARRVAGEVEESIFQPAWSPDGELYFISDRTGWWNLYRWRQDRKVPVAPMEAEFGEPQWVFKETTYAFASPSKIICTYTRHGVSHLASIDTDSGAFREIETPYTTIGSLQAHEQYAVFLAASPAAFPAIVRMDLGACEFQVVKCSSTLTLDAGIISIGEPIEFPTENNRVAYGFFYPPTNSEFTGLPDEKPPLIVISHGGPTAASHNSLKLSIQFFTSRGFAVLDVNYGGSTGYGRAYRERLNGQWGIVDVDDCANGALYLAAQGKVDKNRLAIRGGSAGGFTTLAALTFKNVFKAGASHYGVGDLEALAQDTHKFESRYLDKLIGPYPERADLYRERSPIHAVDQLSCPVIFFQGLEDKVVPPNQAESMVEALKQKGLAVAYLAYEGEQHGFRQAKNIKRTLDAELYFYSRVFEFELAESVEPVPIENL